MSNEADLKALMLEGLRGNAAAHHALLKRLSRHLRAYYMRKLKGFGRNASEAEDLVQEALIAVHTRRSTYDVAEPLTPWLHAIARYKLIDHLRRTRSRLADVPLDQAEEITTDEDGSPSESAYDLDRLLRRLPDKMRRAIQCVKVEGRTVAETARLCAMSEASVKVNVHRGLKALAVAIAHENDRAGERKCGPTT